MLGSLYIFSRVVFFTQKTEFGVKHPAFISTYPKIETGDISVEKKYGRWSPFGFRY